jgi:hypothetical protein
VDRTPCWRLLVVIEIDPISRLIGDVVEVGMEDCSTAQKLASGGTRSIVAHGRERLTRHDGGAAAGSLEAAFPKECSMYKIGSSQWLS